MDPSDTYKRVGGGGVWDLYFVFKAPINGAGWGKREACADLGNILLVDFGRIGKIFVDLAMFGCHYRLT